MQITICTRVRHPFEEIVQGFGPGLLLKLTPPGARLTIRRFDGIYPGAKMDFEIAVPLKTMRWTGHISHLHEGKNRWGFIDRGDLMPAGLKNWQHSHLVLRQSDKTLIVDRVRFSGKNTFFTMVWTIMAFVMIGPRPLRYKKIFR